MAVISLGSLLAYATREVLGRLEGIAAFADEAPAALAIIPLWLLLFHLVGVYRPVAP